jgi:hypothetical protein
MRLSYRTRWLPKAGATVAEYEDAFAPARARHAQTVARKRFAVADGASESLLAGYWAKLLVRTFCGATADRAPALAFGDALERWPNVLGEYLQARERQGDPIQWFEEPGLERGAFSTFVGLHLEVESGARRWGAVAIGDSCLLQFRRGELFETFPRRPGDRFDSAPPLICSKTADSGAIARHTLQQQGTFQQGDTFLLVTDAVAAWFLDAHAGGRGTWAKQLFFAAPTRREFNCWVRHLRSDGSMRNDDVTVMEIRVEE